MGWLGRVWKAIDAGATLDPHSERSAAAWKQWASEHGWSYQAEAPELVGRYRPEYDDGSEWYRYLLITQLHGFRTMAFEHLTFHPEHVWSESESSSHLRSFIVVQLPGCPPAEFVKMGAGRAIGKLGGTVPGGHDLEFVGDELVADRAGHGLDPVSLQAQAELLAWQIGVVPASFWQPWPSGGSRV